MLFIFIVFFSPLVSFISKVLTTGLKSRLTDVPVLLIVCIGNVVAHSYVLHIGIIVIVNIIIFGVAYMLFKILIDMIKNDDVMK